MDGMKMEVFLKTSANVGDCFSVCFSKQISSLAFRSKNLDMVILYDLIDKIEASYTPFQAEEKIQCLQHNQNGDMIASVSKDGNYIVIHDIKSLNRLKIFHRGHRSAKICKMVFSQHNKYFASMSNRGTLHVFSFGDEVSKKENIGKKIVTNSLASYFNYFQSEQALAKIKTEFSSSKEMGPGKVQFLIFFLSFGRSFD